MWMQECVACSSARVDGLHTWMRHLTEHHVLPTEWPSERAAKLTGLPALRPYTTITESKKKRRKDSVPRPLNSFMLFAQHIRRNVLRVFSDASNSVISQQLGDLWRTVSQDFRNRYDDEANRLVKIHQIEFPNYKYQPKKRQPSHSTSLTTGTAESTRTLCAMQTTKESEVTRVSSRNTNSRLPSTEPVLGNDFTRLRSCIGNDPHRALGTKHGESTPHTVASPKPVSKMICRTVPEPKSLGIGVVSGKSNFNNSLSSVLPPLLTPSSKTLLPNHTDVFAHQGSCDSAYASGINSSSSSSASSPAVGDLMSPIKPNLGTVNCLKLSPTRRKIQFIPIRPQSQQVHIATGSAHPTRQRFLSANNGMCSSLQSNSSPQTDHVLAIEPSWSYSSSQPHSTQSVDCDLPKVRRLLAPIYVRLSNENAGVEEDVLLELPPGTTIIQTTDDLAPFSIQNVQPLQPQSVTPPAHQRVLLATQPANSTVQILQPVHVINVDSVTNGKVIGLLANSKTVSPQPQSCCSSSSASSSSSSSWSPALSGDVFLPLQNIHMADMEHDLSHPHQTLLYTTSSRSMDLVHTPEDVVLDTVDIEMCDQFDVDVESPISEFQPDVKIVYGSDCNAAAAVRGISEIPVGQSVSWPISMCQENALKQITGQQDRFLSQSDIVTPLTPLVVDVCKPSPESEFPSDALTEPGTPTPEFEETFDMNFDAMMSSIDITTFLPGTFPDDNQDESITEFAVGGVPPKNDPDLSTHATCEAGSTTMLSLSDSKYGLLIGANNNGMVAKKENPIVTVRGECFANVPFDAASSVNVKEMVMVANDEDTMEDLQMIDIQQLIESNRSHSQLSDLDALDKSSLFSARPEWSLPICE